MKHRLLNLGQLALDLGLSREWLRIEAEAGRIPCLRVDDRLRFNLAAVEQALLERAGGLTTGKANSLTDQ
jgi:hypothetical protein